VTEQAVDLLIVGGGIHGASIARDAAGRGLSVVLCEQGDLAEHASSAGSKLVHGGLAELERGELRRVRAALQERAVLARIAPHLVRPLRLVLPRRRGQRPAWLIQLGLLAQDLLAGSGALPAAARLDLRRDPLGTPLKLDLVTGFAYGDALVDDARLVVLSALDAAERGATIMTRTRCIAASRSDGLWRVELAASQGQPFCQLQARALVNATGAWAAEFLRQRAGLALPRPVSLIKGSLIVVPRLAEQECGYVLRRAEGGFVHVVPWQERWSLVSMAERAFPGEPVPAAAAADEIEELCATVSRYFARPLGPQDVVWSGAALWPARADVEAGAAADERVLVLDAPAREAPLLSVLGGTLGLARQRAEQALAKLQPRLRFGPGPWTATKPLPGGDIEDGDVAAYLAYARGRWPWLGPALTTRYLQAYGTRLERVIGGATCLDGLGADLGDGLHEAEADYLVRHEWAQTEADILWRRTRLGLQAGAGTAARLRGWLHRNSAGAARPAAAPERPAAEAEPAKVMPLRRQLG
jgi:glycerol-3-phosphate dehydrogenase